MQPTLNAALDTADIARFWPDLLDGMHSPRVVTLRPQRIYKFTSRPAPDARPKSDPAASPWWFTDAEYQKMQHFLGLDPGNRGFVARMQAAVHYRWSKMDLLLVAQLNRSLKVFCGPGRWQVEKTQAGGVLCFQAPQDVLQTYIPKLRATAHSPADPEVRSAIQVVEQHELGGLDEIDQAILNQKGNVVLPGNPRIH